MEKSKKRKILVSYYSRTGNTQAVAKELAKQLKCDIDEIIDMTPRAGVSGWLGAGRDASKKSGTEIKFKKDPSEYDLVIVGTPIWAFTVCPAVRVYLSKHKFKKLAFFSTCGGSGIERTFKEMEVVSKKPVAMLAIKSRGWSTKLDLKKDENKEKIKSFVDQLKN